MRYLHALNTCSGLHRTSYVGGCVCLLEGFEIISKTEFRFQDCVLEITKKKK